MYHTIPAQRHSVQSNWNLLKYYSFHVICVRTPQNFIIVLSCQHCHYMAFTRALILSEGLKRGHTSVIWHPSSKCSGRTVSVVCSANCRPTVKQYLVSAVRPVHTLLTHCRRQCALCLHCGNYGLEPLWLAMGTVTTSCGDFNNHCMYTIPSHSVATVPTVDGMQCMYSAAL